MTALPPAVEVTAKQARCALVRGVGLERHEPSSDSAHHVLADLGMIQLDPIDRFGASPDLVVHARVDGHQRGKTAQDLLPGGAFEHYAKELCLLPTGLFPSYRALLGERPRYRHGPRIRDLDPALLDDVEAEIRERGPVCARDLGDRGSAAPHDWSGWKDTQRTASLAVRSLWLRCRVVPVRRTSRGRLWQVAADALPEHHDRPAPSDWRLELCADRVDAAVFLPEATGPWWGGLKPHRQTLIAQLVEQSRAIRVRLPDSRRTWLCRFDPRQAAPLDPDDRMRVVAPLDPLIWDRKLTEAAFDFRYVWEIYKPKAKREWGYYVCPLLHRGQLVGRFEARREAQRLVVDRLWREHPEFDDAAWQVCLERLQDFQAPMDRAAGSAS